MEVEVAVLYRGVIAKYRIRKGAEETCQARLVSYNGPADEAPDAVVDFRKEGRHCSGSTEEQELMDDLYAAIATKPAGDHPRSPDL